MQYKVEYRPGYTLCPRTKEALLYDVCKRKINSYARMDSDKKWNLPIFQLSDISEKPLPHELETEEVRAVMQKKTFLHNEVSWLPITMLADYESERIVEFLTQLVRESNIDFVDRAILEIKSRPADEPLTSEDEDTPKPNLH